MEEKTLAVIKQPVPSNIVRGIYYIIFGILMIVVLFVIGDNFTDDIEDMPFIILIPVLGVIFPILGIGNIIIAISHSGFKEVPVNVSDGKLFVHGHVLSTPIYSKNKIIEFDFSNTKASIKRGNVKGAASKWWKIYITDQQKTTVIRILKLISGDVEKLVNTINNKSV